MAKDQRDHRPAATASEPPPTWKTTTTTIPAGITREDFAAIYLFAHFAPQVINLDRLAAEEGMLLQQRALLGMAKAARTMAQLLFTE